ncbi:hypothetical protein HP439_09410 [Sphingobacterium shayense]|uniref:hypothetical protein n=1 Tax=Sphingobacterium shayense TaxID=626343 RepID=UPI001555B128|nr:hypothetical protein [Sphingobacterium shayense]NQD70933.1 hypothetical protein [Sphingobacterium shayense]
MHNIKKLLIGIGLATVTTPGYTQTDVSKVTEDITSEMRLPTRKEVGKRELSGVYTFVVELDGTLGNIAVKDSAGFGIDIQVVKQLSNAKNWKVPVFEDGPRRIAYSLPIRFHLPKKYKEPKR